MQPYHCEGGKDAASWDPPKRSWRLGANTRRPTSHRKTPRTDSRFSCLFFSLQFVVFPFVFFVRCVFFGSFRSSFLFPPNPPRVTRWCRHAFPLRCCHHERLGCPEDIFDCHAGLKDWRDGWSKARAFPASLTRGTCESQCFLEDLATCLKHF